MDTKQINQTLSLLAAIAVSEIEAPMKSLEYVAEITQHLNELPSEVRDHLIDLWNKITRASEVQKQYKEGTLFSNLKLY